MLSHEWAHDFAERWCDAWNRRDIDGIMSFYAPEVSLISPLVAERWNLPEGRITGKTMLRKNFEVGLENSAMHFRLIAVLLGCNHICIIYRRETGKLVCDTISIDPDMLADRVVACHGTLMGPARETISCT